MGLFPGVALVFGAATGIGRQVALSFASEGCRRISILDYNKAGLAETKALVEAAAPGVEVLPLNVDVRKGNEVVGAVAEAVKRFERIDYAVNSAGIQGPHGPSHSLEVSDFDDIVNTNFKGLWTCSREQLKYMMKQDPLPTHDGRPGSRGSIVNISSMFAHVGQGFLPVYSASKHAVLGITRSDALSYAPHNIRVNCVSPGPIDTAMTAAFADDHPAVLAGPMRRKGQPQEIADVVLFLASSKASYCLGVDVTVDGGHVIN